MKENRWCLFSGGKDSITMTHYCMTHGMADGILFIDTGINLPETVQYVKDVCTKYSWRLEIEKTVHKYEDLVMKFGFPGYLSHTMYFRYLKERPIIAFCKRIEAEEVILYSGVRIHESNRRFRLAKTETKVGKRVYKAPILEWTTERVWEYIKENDLPLNPAYKTLHLSGDCMCGSFASPSEADLIFVFYPELAKRIIDLESKRKQVSDKYCRWGWTNSRNSMTGASRQCRLGENYSCGECQA